MSVFGSNEYLIIEDDLDGDGDAEVTMLSNSQNPIEEHVTWLNEEQARQVIAHLQKLFEL